MSFDADGVYTRAVNSFSNPVLGQTIDPDHADATADDFETALNAVLAKRGVITETDVASATTCDIGAAATLKVRITGTATITSFGTSINRIRFAKFAAALTLTHNGTTLILPGSANITTAENDTAIFFSDASGNWTCYLYKTASGALFTAIADDRILANISGSSAAPIANTLTAIIDACIGSTQGAILTRNASSWVGLAPGTSGHFLKSQGAGADLIYTAVPGGGDLLSSNNLSDVASAATAFGNIKQAATESATGVVELATTAEAATGTDTTRAVTAAGVKAANGWVLIETQTATSSAQLDFTTGIDSTYSHYVFVLASILPATDTAVLYMRISTDGGSTYKSGASDYSWAANIVSSASSNTPTGTNATSQIQITGTLSNNSGRPVSGIVDIFSPSVGTINLHGVASQYFDGTNIIGWRGVGTYNIGTAVNAIRFLMSSGNIASGTISLYGVRKT